MGHFPAAENPFAAQGMPAGYATARPPVHPLIVGRIRRALTGRRFQRALDVGCGAGLSTRPLAQVAENCIGLEPVEAMLQWHVQIAPGAAFLAARAETIPLRPHSVDLIATAGSLNYVDLSRFFPEAVRVLTPGGVLVVYDFSPGRSFIDGPELDRWFSEFERRYPWPRGRAKEISPESLAHIHPLFRVTRAERFEIPLPMTAESYTAYMMTETNVGDAVARGTPAEAVRSWCRETLAPLFAGTVREVVFSGYFACLSVSDSAAPATTRNIPR